MTVSLDYWLTTPRLNLAPHTALDFGEASLRILDDESADTIQTAMYKRLISLARPGDTYAPKVDAFRGVTSLALSVTDTKLDHAMVRQIGRRYELLIFLTEAFTVRRSQIHRLLEHRSV